MVTKHIPNFLTICNLSCGCIGIVLSFKGNLHVGAFMIWAGALFDFFDGFAARMLKKYSAIGKDLDSLADLITFCFLPGTIIYMLIGQNTQSQFLPFAGFLLVIFGALRLAKFNNDTRQSETFYGLPVPAAAIFVSAYPFINVDTLTGFAGFMTGPYTLTSTVVLLSALMVSDIKLMSFKFKSFGFLANWPRYLLLALALILIIFFKIMALPVIILVYVVFSIALNISE
jgi:CDP-diacylglycerol---serine O-phosphatidyltransferase